MANVIFASLSEGWVVGRVDEDDENDPVELPIEC